MTPFIKWAGGKRDLVDVIRPLILERMSIAGRYFEPFLGGGAIALSMDVETCVVGSDACEDLIEAWMVVRSETLALSQRLAALAVTHSKEQYYAVREMHVMDDRVARAARFIYLNKTGFNGLYRKNRQGRFNVPIGRGRSSSIPTYGELKHVAARSLDWHLECVDFERAIECAETGDCIYADPPYDKTFDYSSRFDTVDRARLAACLRRAARRGVGVVVTDADTPLVRRLYAWADVRDLSERRKIAANGDRRDAACVVAVRP